MLERPSIVFDFWTFKNCRHDGRFRPVAGPRRS